MKIPANRIREQLKKEYNMDNEVYPMGQDVIFFGTELDCFKMAYKMRNKECKVAYSENLKTWYINFPYWFSINFSQNII